MGLQTVDGEVRGNAGKRRGQALGVAMAVRGNTRKSFSKAADKAGARGCHGTRPAQRGRSAGRQEKLAVKSLVVRGNDGVCKAS